MLSVDLMPESKSSRGGSASLHTEVEAVAIMDCIQTMAAHGMVEMQVSFVAWGKVRIPRWMSVWGSGLSEGR